MSRFLKAGPVQHVLGDRIGHDCARQARQHMADTKTDRGDRGRRARRIGASRCGRDGAADIHNRQRGGEDRSGVLRIAIGQGDRRSAEYRAPFQKRAIGDHIKRRQRQFDASPPQRNRQVRSDSRRLAERQRKRLRHRYLRSIIA
jgi:hypothetical protein